MAELLKFRPFTLEALEAASRKVHPPKPKPKPQHSDLWADVDYENQAWQGMHEEEW